MEAPHAPRALHAGGRVPELVRAVHAFAGRKRRRRVPVPVSSSFGAQSLVAEARGAGASRPPTESAATSPANSASSTASMASRARLARPTFGARRHVPAATSQSAISSSPAAAHTSGRAPAARPPAATATASTGVADPSGCCHAAATTPKRTSQAQHASGRPEGDPARVALGSEGGGAVVVRREAVAARRRASPRPAAAGAGAERLFVRRRPQVPAVEPARRVAKHSVLGETRVSAETAPSL